MNDEEYDDFEISIRIIVNDKTQKMLLSYGAEILDDETVHAIIEQVAKAREKMSILVQDITFYMVDEDGNDKGKTYRLKPEIRCKELEYLTEDFTEDMLEEVNDESKIK